MKGISDSDTHNTSNVKQKRELHFSPQKFCGHNKWDIIHNKALDKLQ